MILPVPLSSVLVDSPDGEIRFVGSRIALYHVVDAFNEGYSPELILGLFPTLNLLSIYKAIVFYLENRELVDKMIAEINARAAKLRAESPKAPSLAELRRRVEARAHAEREKVVV